MDRKVFDYIIIAVIVVFLILLLCVFMQMRAEGSKCISNPLPYGVAQIQKANTYTFGCVCSFNAPGSPMLKVNSTNVFQEKIEYDYSGAGIDLSNITLK